MGVLEKAAAAADCVLKGIDLIAKPFADGLRPVAAAAASSPLTPTGWQSGSSEAKDQETPGEKPDRDASTS